MKQYLKLAFTVVILSLATACATTGRTPTTSLDIDMQEVSCDE